MHKKNSILLPLCEEDLAMNRKLIVCDLLDNGKKLGRMRKYVNSGFLIVAMKVSPKVKEDVFYRELIERDRIRQFTWHVFPFVESVRGEEYSFDVVERLFTALQENGKIPLTPLINLYGHRDVEMTFKKALILRLAKFFHTVNCVDNLSKSCEGIKFWPSYEWTEVYQWIKNAGLKSCLPSVFSRSEIFLLDAFQWHYVFFALKVKLRFLMKLLGIPVFVVSRIRNLRIKPVSKRNIQLAIRLYNNDFGFRGEGSRKIDWPLDGKRLHAGNTLFVAETMLDRDYIREIKKRNYNFVQCDRREIFYVITLSFLFKELLLRSFINFFPLVYACLYSPSLFIEVSIFAWIDYLRWKCFLDFWRPKFYLSYHHYDYSHIFRNLLFSQVNSKCWYYNHSNSNYEIYEYKRNISGRHSLYSYMRYDKEIQWGKQRLCLAKTEYGRSQSIVACGPIWSAEVRRDMFLESAVQGKWGDLKNNFLIAAFNTSYGIDGINRGEDHLCFLLALKKILESPRFPNIKIIFKPKKRYEFYYWSREKEVFNLYQELKDNPRFLVLDRHIASNSVIYAADITVTMAFASPATEALMANRRAVYFDPCNRYPCSYYECFPNLVAHTEEGLINLISYWLETTDDVFKTYINDYIVPEFGGNINTNASEFIREEISKS